MQPTIGNIAGGVGGLGGGSSSSGGGGGGGGAPTLPADQTFGTPAAKMICWGNNPWALSVSQATYQTWFNRGHKGWKAGFQWLYGYGGTYDFQGSDASGQSGSQWSAQKTMEGATGTIVQSNNVGDESYLGFYFSSYQGGSYSSNPPYGSWFNDTTWTGVVSTWQQMAQAVSYMGMTGLGLDTEYSTWGAETGYTLAQTKTEARARGYSIGSAIWGAMSNLILLWYDYYPPAGWNNKVQQVVNSASYPSTTSVETDFFEGLLNAMSDLGATGRIVLIDASFYRSAADIIGNSNATNQNAYYLNSQGSRAYWSTYFDQSVWNYACDHVDLTGFTWLTDDGTTYYDNTEPSESTWSQWLLDARKYSEGPRRGEYNYNGWSGSISVYSDATSIAGTEAAADTTPLSTSVPALSLISATSSGGTVTITCNATHAYGVRCVKIYDGSTFSASNPAASYLGAMTMVWNANGGNYTTNYNSAYQQCTFATSGSSGHWYVLAATSIKDDVKWTSVQST